MASDKIEPQDRSAMVLAMIIWQVAKFLVSQLELRYGFGEKKSRK